MHKLSVVGANGEMWGLQAEIHLVGKVVEQGPGRSDPAGVTPIGVLGASIHLLLLLLKSIFTLVAQHGQSTVFGERLG